MRVGALLLTLVVGCGASDVPPSSTADGSGGEGGAPFEAPPAIDAAVYASSVEALELGEGAGYNEDKLPDIVLGPPRGGGMLKGSLDVLSLGSGGEIVLGFGDHGVYVALSRGLSFAPARLVKDDYGRLAGGWTTFGMYPRYMVGNKVVGFGDAGVFVDPLN